MTTFLQELETVLSAAGSGRWTLTQHVMPRHAARWRKCLATALTERRKPVREKDMIGWEENCRVFVEEVYPRLCLGVRSDEEAIVRVDEAIDHIWEWRSSRSGLQEHPVDLALALGRWRIDGMRRLVEEHRPTRYAIENGLLAGGGQHFAVTKAGTVVAGLIGLERLRLLLALEVCQSRGVGDRWRVDEQTLRDLVAGRPMGVAWDLDTDDRRWLRALALDRLAAMGVLEAHHDDEREYSSYAATPVSRGLVHSVLDEGPIRHLARALLADEQARVFGDPGGRSASAVAAGQARMIAHEVRNKVAAMRLTLDRMGEAGSTPELGRLAAGLAGIERFVDSMADTARLIGGGSTFSIVVAVREAIDSAEAESGTRARLAAGEGELHVEGTRADFVGAVLNILRNAWQVRPDVTVEVRVSQSIDGRRITVVIDDDGPGVPLNAREIIFRDGVGLRDGGSGAGLALARRTIDDMGGKLTCSEAPVGGARFRIELPVAGARR